MRIQPRQSGNMGLEAPSLGDVLVCADPTAIYHRPVPYRDDASVGKFAV